MLKQISIASAALGFALVCSPAAAQVSLGLGADADVELGVDVRVGDPYTYDGRRSGHWYAYHEPNRDHVYYDRYGGYDCYKAYYYTWHNGHRARYDSYWCYDDRGRKYEVSDTRVIVRID